MILPVVYQKQLILYMRLQFVFVVDVVHQFFDDVFPIKQKVKRIFFQSSKVKFSFHISVCLSTSKDTNSKKGPSITDQPLPNIFNRNGPVNIHVPQPEENSDDEVLFFLNSLFVDFVLLFFLFERKYVNVTYVTHYVKCSNTKRRHLKKRLNWNTVLLSVNIFAY